jgi:hypothetical protein
MARPTLFAHRKFVRLVSRLGSRALALGHLELIWYSAGQSGDDLLGDATDVELAAGWDGDPGALVEMLVTAGGAAGGGFIDEREGLYYVHDLYDHAPDYVRKRADREASRVATGRTISEIRAEAGRKGGKRSGETRAASTGELGVEANEASGAVCFDDSKQTEARARTPSPSPALKEPLPTSEGVPAHQDSLLLPTFALSAPDEGPKARARAGFAEFWGPYPNKKSKADAEKAWAQTYGKRPPLPELLAILERHKLTEQWQRDDGKGIPYGATWLRGSRWEDVLEVTGMPATNGTNGHTNGRAAGPPKPQYQPVGYEDYELPLGGKGVQ